MKTASAGVNLHSLMVRFSFVRDCGSIPHGDFSKKGKILDNFLREIRLFF